MKPYICFLDLLGIKDLAKYNPEAYFLAMEKFRNNILITSEKLRVNESPKENKIFFFSDSAFIQTTELEVLFSFLREFRMSLMREQIPIYFNGAVTIGEIKAISYNTNSRIPSLKNIELKNLLISAKKNANINGTIFYSSDVSKVYILQNEFKGIGIFVDNEALNQKKRQIAESTSENDVEEKFNKFKLDFITTSYFFQNINSNSTKIYYDLKLVSGETSESKLGVFLEGYLRANAKNVKNGRYYISLLVNWIKSEDFSKISLDNSPTIIKDDKIEDLALDSEFESIINKVSFKDIPSTLKLLLIEEDVIFKNLKTKAHGIDYIIFSLLSKFYSDNPTFDDITYHVLLYFFGRNKSLISKYLNHIDEIPEGILSSNQKDRFVHDYHRFLRDEQKKKNEVKERNRVKNKNK